MHLIQSHIGFENSIPSQISKMEQLRNINSNSGWRHAGILEVLLLMNGVLKYGVKFDYQKGGKVYFPVFLDFRWIETYPQHMLRLAKEHMRDVQAKQCRNYDLIDGNFHLSSLPKKLK